MYFVFEKLIYTSTESIIVSMTYKKMQFRHVSETVNKMPFLPAMIPDKMRLFCTQFDGGAVVVEGFIYIHAIIQIFSQWWYT